MTLRGSFDWLKSETQSTSISALSGGSWMVAYSCEVKTGYNHFATPPCSAAGGVRYVASLSAE